MDLGPEHMEKLGFKAESVSKALQQAGIPHGVIGGLAIAAHVGSVKHGIVRNTKDMDILLNRADLQRAADALRPLGFRYRKIMGIHCYVPHGGKFVDAVHVILAGEKVRETDPVPAPELLPEILTDAPSGHGFWCIDLPRLLRMKLTSFRINDKTHIRDLILSGLITRKVEATIPAELKERWQAIKAEVGKERLN